MRREERAQLDRAVGSLLAYVRHAPFGAHPPRDLRHALGVGSQDRLELSQVGLSDVLRASLTAVCRAGCLHGRAGGRRLLDWLGRRGRLGPDRVVGLSRRVGRSGCVKAYCHDGEAHERKPHDDPPTRQAREARGRRDSSRRTHRARRGPLEPSPISTGQHRCDPSREVRVRCRAWSRRRCLAPSDRAVGGGVYELRGEEMVDAFTERDRGADGSVSDLLERRHGARPRRPDRGHRCR